MSSKINVTVDGISILTEEYFDTRIPAIKSISPLYAPQYGGSKITMCGENLLIGASRTVTAGKVCDILETWSNGTGMYTVVDVYTLVTILSHTYIRFTIIATATPCHLVPHPVRDSREWDISPTPEADLIA